MFKLDSPLMNFLSKVADIIRFPVNRELMEGGEEPPEVCHLLRHITYRFYERVQN